LKDLADSPGVAHEPSRGLRHFLVGLAICAVGAAAMVYGVLHWGARVEARQHGERSAKFLARTLSPEASSEELERNLARMSALQGLRLVRGEETWTAGVLPEDDGEVHSAEGPAGRVQVAVRQEVFGVGFGPRFFLLLVPTILALTVCTWMASWLERRRRMRFFERMRSELARLESSDYNSPVDPEGLGELGPTLDRLQKALAAERATLKEQNDELEATAQLKSRFLANMSHEIRTPLTAILGFTEMLDDRSLSAERRTRAVDTVRRNGRHLLLIVNDVLDLSKIQAGRMTVERIPVALRDTLQDIEEVFAPRAASKKLAFDVTVDDSVPKLVESDPTRLRQILANLVGNALKFTAEGEVMIHVSAEVDAETNEALVEFRIRDTGVGLTDDAKRKIFEPFVQADASVTRRYGGTGLGLAISRQLADLLGGELNCSSRVGEGSEFVLTIRGEVCQSSSQVLAGQPFRESSEVDPESQRVLVVEDSRDNQILIELLLKKYGVQVSVADNGAHGLEVIAEAVERKRPFHLVLMDMQMPVMDGYEATKRVRKDFPDLPVVALTAHALAGDRERCLDVGCSDFISKPINRDALFRVLMDYGLQERDGEERPSA
jgi:signal transduction histidine kinase/CheY-like chemotaxis protein